MATNRLAPTTIAGLRCPYIEAGSGIFPGPIDWNFEGEARARAPARRCTLSAPRTWSALVGLVERRKSARRDDFDGPETVGRPEDSVYMLSNRAGLLIGWALRQKESPR